VNNLDDGLAMFEFEFEKLDILFGMDVEDGRKNRIGGLDTHRLL
jgi:hypothetical protein